MSQLDLHLYLDTYISVREALGFQMRAERTLLRDFVRFIEQTHSAGPIQAQMAVDWACASSTKRGRGSASQRLSMARRFLAYVKAALPETEIPERDLVASARRPKPFLFRVAYPLAADNVSRPLVSRLSRVNQPVISTRNAFQSLAQPCWSASERTSATQHHDHQPARWLYTGRGWGYGGTRNSKTSRSDHT